MTDTKRTSEAQSASDDAVRAAIDRVIRDHEELLRGLSEGPGPRAGGPVARARLDADGTAKPLTEIVGVMPENAIGEGGKTVHVGQATHYVARPTEAETRSLDEMARDLVTAAFWDGYAAAKRDLCSANAQKCGESQVKSSDDRTSKPVAAGALPTVPAESFLRNPRCATLLADHLGTSVRVVNEEGETLITVHSHKATEVLLPPAEQRTDHPTSGASGAAALAPEQAGEVTSHEPARGPDEAGTISWDAHDEGGAAGGLRGGRVDDAAASVPSPLADRAPGESAALHRAEPGRGTRSGFECAMCHLDLGKCLDRAECSTSAAVHRVPRTETAEVQPGDLVRIGMAEDQYYIDSIEPRAWLVLLKRDGKHVRQEDSVSLRDLVRVTDEKGGSHG